MRPFDESPDLMLMALERTRSLSRAFEFSLAMLSQLHPTLDTSWSTILYADALSNYMPITSVLNPSILTRCGDAGEYLLC